MIRLIEVLAAGVTDDSGNPVDSGTVTFYEAGTTTLYTVYSDFELETPHSNPATLDSAGRLIAYADTRVKIVIASSAGVTIRTIDDVGTADSDLSQTSADTLAGDGLLNTDGVLSVRVDGSTLEINTDVARVRADGITPLQTSAAATWMGIQNCVVTASVASSALTIALKTQAGTDATSTDVINIPFRSSTITSGAYNRRQVTSALSTVISSTSTAGHGNGAEWPIYVYAIDYSGTVELAWSSSPYDERYLATTTAEGGAGAADSVYTLYSTTARSSVPIRLLAVLKSNQPTAGTWSVVPVAISPPGLSTFSQLPYRKNHTTVGVGGIGISSASGNYQNTGTSTADVTNLSVTISTCSRPVVAMLIPTTTASAIWFSRSNTSAGGTLSLVRDATTVGIQQYSVSAGGATSVSGYGAAPVFYDLPSAGTYTYKIQATGDYATNSPVFGVLEMKLVVYEI